MNDILIISGTTFVLDTKTPSTEAEGGCLNEALEWQAIEAESVGWWPLGDDAYLHAVDRLGVGVTVVSVVGVSEDVQEGVLTLLLA
mgnify:CR=1 FL=1